MNSINLLHIHSKLIPIDMYPNWAKWQVAISHGTLWVSKVPIYQLDEIGLATEIQSEFCA